MRLKIAFSLKLFSEIIYNYINRYDINRVNINYIYYEQTLKTKNKILAF